MGQGELEGMPEPEVLRLNASDGQVLVTWGRTLVYRYDAEDLGMRNLAIVALTDAGRRVDEVAQARAWAGAGWTQQAICERLGCARSVISVLLDRLGPTPVQEGLPAAEHAEPEATESESTPDDTELTKPDIEPVVAEPATELVAPPAGSARIETGSYRCRYAGAMMLFPSMDVVGAQAIFGTPTGGPARRYGDLSVLTTATLGFALGACTIEGTKHLRRGEAGAAVGLAVTPQLGTLRGRLSALADN